MKRFVSVTRNGARERCEAYLDKRRAGSHIPMTRGLRESVDLLIVNWFTYRHDGSLFTDQ
jgi:hypothetical protein